MTCLHSILFSLISKERGIINGAEIKKICLYFRSETVVLSLNIENILGDQLIL